MRFIYWFAVLLVSYSFGQEKAVITEKKYGFDFQLDNRFSFISNESVTIFGAKFGVAYKDITRFGIGVSLTINPVILDYIDKQTQEIKQNNVRLAYFSLYNDWIIYDQKKWKIFVTEQIGLGKPRYTKIDTDEIINEAKRILFINELSTQVHFKVCNWLGVGVGAGYRNIWNKSSQLKNAFNAPIYIAKIIIYPSEIFRKQNNDKSMN